PGTRVVPETAIPALIPMVPPAPKVSVLPDRHSALVVAVTGAAGGLGITANVMTEPSLTSPETPVPLNVTVVAVTLPTIAPGGIFVPETDIPVLIPLVLPKVRVLPDGQSAVVVAVTGGPGGLGISANVITAPLGTSAETPGLSVTV